MPKRKRKRKQMKNKNKLDVQICLVGVWLGERIEEQTR